MKTIGKRKVGSKCKCQAYQHSLQLTHRLMLHRLPIDLPDFVAHVQRGLSVYHAAVHDARHNAAPVLGHFKRDALQQQSG